MIYARVGTLMVGLLLLGATYAADSLSTQNLPDSSQKLTNIAVLTLKNSDGITAGDASLITDRLNIELFNTGRVNLMERDQIKEILSEQGFQGSGACNDEACLVEMGQILGVQEIITGSLGKLGSLLIINMRCINVTSGQIVKVVSQDIPGKIEDVVRYLPNIARKLVGLEPSDILPQPSAKVAVEPQKPQQPGEVKPAKNTGLLAVKTVPEGADVFLNGKKLGVTPFTDNSLIPGKYTLNVQMRRYESYSETFTASAGSSKVVAVNLIYKYGLLTVLSKPEGATVAMNTVTAGKTPYQNDTLAPGEYKLDLSLAGYKSISERYTVVKSTRDTLLYTLFSTAQLDSIKTANKEQSRGKRNARRVLFGLIAAGAWGTGIAFNAQTSVHEENAQDYYKEYIDYDPDINGSVTVDQWNTMYQKAKDEQAIAKDKSMIRNILYGSGGLFTLFFVLSIPF